MTIELTEEQFSMVSFCVENLSTDYDREFEPEDEKNLKEVAEIFRKMYKEKIKICEEKLFQTENCRESFKIQRLKKRLEFELNIFNKRNPE